LKQHDFAEYNWLPATCAYRLLSDGEELPAWHPLRSKSADSVQDAGVSISSYAMKNLKSMTWKTTLLNGLD